MELNQERGVRMKRTIAGLLVLAGLLGALWLCCRPISLEKVSGLNDPRRWDEVFLMDFSAAEPVDQLFTEPQNVDRVMEILSGLTLRRALLPAPPAQEICPHSNYSLSLVRHVEGQREYTDLTTGWENSRFTLTVKSPDGRVRRYVILEQEDLAELSALLGSEAAPPFGE